MHFRHKLIHSFYTLKTKDDLIKEFFKGVFILKLLNNQLVSSSLINFDCLLCHTSHFVKNIILPFLVLTTFGFLLSVFFLHFKQQDNIV